MNNYLEFTAEEHIEIEEGFKQCKLDLADAKFRFIPLRTLFLILFSSTLFIFFNSWNERLIFDPGTILIVAIFLIGLVIVYRLSYKAYKEVCRLEMDMLYYEYPNSMSEMFNAWLKNHERFTDYSTENSDFIKELNPIEEVIKYLSITKNS